MLSLFRLAGCCVLGLSVGGCTKHREIDGSHEPARSNFLENALMSFLGVPRFHSPLNARRPMVSAPIYAESQTLSIDTEASPTQLPSTADALSEKFVDAPRDSMERDSIASTTLVDSVNNSRASGAPAADVSSPSSNPAPAPGAPNAEALETRRAADGQRLEQVPDRDQAQVVPDQNTPSDKPPTPAPQPMPAAESRAQTLEQQRRTESETATRRALWNEVALRFGAGRGFTGETAGQNGSTGVGAGPGHTGIGAGSGYTGVGAGSGYTGVGAGKGSTGTGASPLPSSLAPHTTTVTALMLIVTPWGPTLMPVIAESQ